ncbi:MAG: aminotransferase class I/II-fold pyridoxal phosphate-dependent enzyme [Brumimicrobium sp.]|nr:aminotransferase class I/II-fold pyridoxal phosphate-dependent enzyme [Brumimicrobium sp.]
MKKHQFETLLIRTQTEKTVHKEHSVPLFLTSSFTFDSAEEGAGLFSDELKGNLYSRFSNPNTDEFSEKLRLVENAEAGVATATGMAAVFVTFASLLKSGDHVIASSAIFGNSLKIIKSILPDYGIDYTLVDVDDNKAWQQAVKKNTRMLFIETPSNPTLKIADLTFLNELAKAKNLIYVVDNCFATPYLQQPIDFGADIVLHSATKYIDGQGRVLGGAILGKKEFVDKAYDFIRRTGASLSPFNAWVLSKSLETLPVRMDRHCENAEKVYRFLKSRKDILQVIYPHGEEHPQVKLAKKQMSRGGGLVGCELKGGKERGARFLNALKLHSLTANLGDTRSIATHPASTTHSKLSVEEQISVGISPGFIRFSVGLEHIDDILEDIEQALKLSV